MQQIEAYVLGRATIKIRHRIAMKQIYKYNDLLSTSLAAADFVGWFYLLLGSERATHRGRDRLGKRPRH